MSGGLASICGVCSFPQAVVMDMISVKTMRFSVPTFPSHAGISLVVSLVVMW